MPEPKLPTEVERTAFRLRDKQGLSDSEIAEVMSCSRETACRRRHRYVAKLQRIRLEIGNGSLDDLVKAS